jgi:hypothetical protein
MDFKSLHNLYPGELKSTRFNSIGTIFCELIENENYIDTYICGFKYFSLLIVCFMLHLISRSDSKKLVL